MNKDEIVKALGASRHFPIGRAEDYMCMACLRVYKDAIGPTTCPIKDCQHVYVKWLSYRP